MGNLWFGLQTDPEKALSLPPLPAQPVVTEFKSLREGPAAREQQGKRVAELDKWLVGPCWLRWWGEAEGVGSWGLLVTAAFEFWN